MAFYKDTLFLEASFLLLLSISPFSFGELVDFTCFNSNPLLSITNTGNTYIGGYKGNVALLGDAVTFGRTVSTATGDGLPSCSCIPNPGDGRGSATVRQYMNCPSGFCSCGGTGSSCLYRIGAFYCQIDTGTTVERITTITLNSNADIIPKRQTITVSLEESLTLEVSTTLSQPPDWRWRKTSATFNNWLRAWFGTQFPHINSVSEADAGVYECHVPGQREQGGRHAIFRVIVRGCPSNMWGTSTGCQNVCPVCYNGGMCHDVTGQCICAPGFSGSNCHIANGRNAWGLNGTLPCASAEDRHGASCMGRLFCLQDPFGCSCAAGYKGIGCDQECDESNTFGPYCTQTCHCADGITCLKDTGECNDPSCTDEYCPQRCDSGWKGRNCQVRTPCQLGYYGEICTQRCNCRDNQACNEETGACLNGCADGYRGAACDQDVTRAIVAFGQTNKPNAGQPVTVQCETVGNPLPTEDDIILQDSRGNQINPFSSINSTGFNDYRRINEYVLTGDDAVSGARLTCYLRTLDNNYLQKYLTLDLYNPPFLVSFPYASNRYSTSIKVRWSSWTSAQGRGDGPVLRYEVHYRLRSDDVDDTTYEFVETASTNTSTSLVIGELAVGTEYDFVVVVVREGDGGAGPPSPKVTIGTTCATPTTAPTVQLDVVSSTELRLSWQFPPESTWQCSSLQYVQVYRKQSSESEFNTIQYGSTGTLAALGSLAPCTSYDVYVTFTNRDGLYSPDSIIVTATTATTVPGPVTSLRIFNPTGSSHNQLGVSWSSPSADNNCPVDAYIISHSLTRIKACGSSSVDPGTVSQTVVVPAVSLNNLKPYSSYRVSVVAVNSVGNSTVSASSADTSATVSSFVPTVNVLDSDITSNSIRFTWDEVSCEDLNGPYSSYTYHIKLTNLATDELSTHSTNHEVRWSTGLTPCTTYSFQVAVVNTVGVGTYSNATEVTTKAVVPSQVSDLSAEAVDGYPTVLRVQWNPPSGNCPIDHYTVSYDLYWLLKCEYPVSNRIEAGRTANTEYNITGLFPNSRYRVYVRATTSAGEGSEDYEYVYTAEAAPSEPPQNVINTATLRRSLRFAWQSPSCLGRRGEIVGYTYRLIDLERGGENVTEDTSSSVTDADIDGLVPYTLYSFQVLARTAAGDGPYSDAMKLRTDQAKPPQITSVTTPSGDVTSITVQWPRPDPPNGIIIAYYVVYGIVSRVNQTLQVTEGLNDTIVQVELTGLVSESNYSIQIQAETVVNRGPLSEPIYRIIRYRDTYPPVFTANSCPSPIFRVAEPRSMVTMVTWTHPTATDSSDVTVECTPASGANFMIGQTPVTCTATDAAGNKATTDCTFTVTVTVPAKLLPPVVSDNSTNHITETTIKLRVAPVSQRNGPVSCVEVTVIRLTDEEGIEGKDPDVLYHPDLLRSFDDAQELTGLPYVAMVFKANDLSESVEIEIGSGGKSSCGGSRRKKRQTPPSHSGENGPLIPKTKYTAFIRAYVLLDNQMEDYITSPLLKPVWTDPSGTGNTAVIAVVSVVSTTLIIALIACGVRVWIRRKKRRNKYSPPKRTSMKMDRIDYDDGTLPEGGMASTVYEDVGLPSWALRWEILWKNLVVDDKVLGQGNFGEVRSGTVNIGGKKTKTAIKILKGHASKTDREDFMEEFRTMTDIGYHPNVVSLLGACQHEDVLYVSLEYLPNGDLRSYLRTARSQSESDEGALSSEMLIKFALDVAKGMNHLSVSGVIHRDLAARNILLGEQLVAKVSDFGLSRGEDTYVQTSTRRVPTRWLAIESLLDRTYTTQSDVWSFGILLWEIASIGGTPYPAIATRSLVGRLMEGYRMTKPANCDKQIYSLMLRCWEEDPSNRPSFSDLIRIISKMDENKIEQTYMAIDRAHYENFSVIRPELDDN